MGLIYNNSYNNNLNFLAGNNVGLSDFSNRNNGAINNALTFKSKVVSVPVGCYNGAFVLPISMGGIAAHLQGIGSTNIDLNGVGNLDVTLNGDGTVTFVNLAGGINLTSDLEGNGTFTADATATAMLNALIRIGASPSADDIVYAMLDTPSGNIDNLSLRKALQVMISIMAGKTIIDEESSTVKFRDMADTKDRVTTQMSDSERMNITIE